ncbi:MAG: hypothetical protein DCC59_00455 [Chloroflexi bacterium]|nr:MAG: hypothetical protein DCC59_00455 [Chloroflexota bacterium]
MRDPVITVSPARIRRATPTALKTTCQFEFVGDDVRDRQPEAFSFDYISLLNRQQYAKKLQYFHFCKRYWSEGRFKVAPSAVLGAGLAV